MRKTAPEVVEWTNQRKEDFVFLCSALADKCLLHVPVPSDSFILQTDASGCGIDGVVRVCRKRGGVTCCVPFAAAQNSGKELLGYGPGGLAVVDSVRHFEVYL